MLAENTDAYIGSEMVHLRFTPELIQNTESVLATSAAKTLWTAGLWLNVSSLETTMNQSWCCTADMLLSLRVCRQDMPPGVSVDSSKASLELELLFPRSTFITKRLLSLNVNSFISKQTHQLMKLQKKLTVDNNWDCFVNPRPQSFQKTITNHFCNCYVSFGRH